MTIGNIPSIDSLLRLIRILANATIAIVSASFQAPHQGLIKPLADYADDHGWLAILVGAVVIWLTTWRLNRSHDPNVNEILRTLLAEFRDRIFPRMEGQHCDYRVTLFAYRSSYWRGILRGKNPRSGWLVPFVRPGHTAQRTGTFFWAPDDSSRGRGRRREGVGRQYWASLSNGIARPHRV